MPRLPDRFDLWVRKARTTPEPLRQIDYVLGALVALPEWHFLNSGTKESPQPAETDLENEHGLFLLLFTDSGRIAEIFGDPVPSPLPVISMPTPAAMAWVLEQPVAGLLVNAGEDAVLVPHAQLAAFHLEWLTRGGRQASGFWIPNLTSEEEDFWQEHGL